jgi:hypothetical protein
MKCNPDNTWHSMEQSSSPLDEPCREEKPHILLTGLHHAVPNTAGSLQPRYFKCVYITFKFQLFYNILNYSAFPLVTSFTDPNAYYYTKKVQEA